MNTTELDNAITRMMPTATQDEVVAAYDFILAIGTKLADYKKMARERMVEWLKDHPGERLTAGERYWTLGNKSETWCNDVAGTVEAVLIEAGGDTKPLSECLSVNAFKPSQCKKLLPPEAYAKLFTTEKKEVLVDGKPAKELIEGNTAFMR